MNYPEYVEINGQKYKINTDFRVAIECNEIALNKSIDDEERALAIIFKLYGKKGLEDIDNYKKLLECGQKFLTCGKGLQETTEKPDMDYIEDIDYIEASFMSDYQLDLSSIEMHWWKFNKLMEGLSNSEMGNCCVLNRIRNLRNYDMKDIKDPKERSKILKAKQQVALKRNLEPKKKPTNEQLENAKEFLNALGYGGD